jgi:hypothetical protein
VLTSASKLYNIDMPLLYTFGVHCVKMFNDDYSDRAQRA